jgi:hypothetical protein
VATCHLEAELKDIPRILPQLKSPVALTGLFINQEVKVSAGFSGACLPFGASTTPPFDAHQMRNEQGLLDLTLYDEQ